MNRVLPPVLLIALLVAFSLVAPRLQEGLPGFSPMPAMFYCVAACMGTRWLWLPLTAWLLSYALTNLTQGYGWNFQVTIALGIVLGGLAVAVGIGCALRGKNWMALVGGSVGAAVLFYVVTNTGSWLMLPDYPKTWAGLVQAQTVGLPGLPPAWAFLKGLVSATALFTGLFLLGQRKWGAFPVASTVQPPLRTRR